MNKILIIEDDKDINSMLTKLLEINNYSVVNAYTGLEGVSKHNSSIDLIILDLMLPYKNGNEIVKDLKNIKDVPILVTTAITEMDTKLDLFDLGVEDYITKPFNNDELLARIKVHLKNTPNDILCFKEIRLNLNDYSCYYNDTKISLSKTEFDLLKLLMQKPNNVHTKNFLIESVWSDSDSADDNTLNVHISNLRNKIKNVSNEDYIETIWSIGYKLKK